MYKTFAQFTEQQETDHFGQAFCTFCENVALSQVSFEEAWDQHFLPVLLENPYASDTELLNEFGMPNWMSGMFGGQQQQKPDMIGQLNQWQQDPSAVGSQANAEAEKAKKLEAIKHKMVSGIQQLFVKSMRNFLREAQAMSYKSGSHLMWKGAEDLFNKAMQFSQKWSPGVKWGKPGYLDAYNQGKNTWSQQQPGQLLPSDDPTAQQPPQPQQQPQPNTAAA